MFSYKQYLYIFLYQNILIYMYIFMILRILFINIHKIVNIINIVFFDIYIQNEL